MLLLTLLLLWLLLQALAAKQATVAQLTQQLDEAVACSKASSADHEINLHKLVSSLTQMQEACQVQALEVQQAAAAQQALQQERASLRQRLKQQDALITVLQVSGQPCVGVSVLQRAAQTNPAAATCATAAAAAVVV